MGNGLVTWLKAGKGVLGPGRSRFQLEALRQSSWLLVATVAAGRNVFDISEVLVRFEYLRLFNYLFIE